MNMRTVTLSCHRSKILMTHDSSVLLFLDGALALTLYWRALRSGSFLLSRMYVDCLTILKFNYLVTDQRLTSPNRALYAIANKAHAVRITMINYLAYATITTHPQSVGYRLFACGENNGVLISVRYVRRNQMSSML